MEKPQLFTEVCTVLAECFGSDISDINPKTCADNMEGWDSLNNVKMLLALEKKFGIRFSGMEATSLEDVGQLIDLVDSKLQQKTA